MTVERSPVAGHLLGSATYLTLRVAARVVPATMRPLLIDWFGKDWPCQCPVCGDRVGRFFPLPRKYSRQLVKYGSDLRLADFETCNVDAYRCPHCGATDRDRLSALYLELRLSAESRGVRPVRLLDIAPSPALSRHLTSRFRLDYRTADLFQPGVDDRVDITDMSCYPSSSFDAVLCSHVLEHVEDDGRAVSELYRVLEPGGWGIIMVPINLVVEHTREVETKSEAERWQLFGQGDHVRLYTRRDFVDRLRRPGFVVTRLVVGDFPNVDPARFGLSKSSALYVVEKPRSPSSAPPSQPLRERPGC